MNSQEHHHAVTQTDASSVLSESPLFQGRPALIALLRQHLMVALRLNQEVCRLQLKLRNVSFVDLRELFHRIGNATAQCADFLDERIRDMGGVASFQRRLIQALSPGQDAPGHDPDFATAIERVSHYTHELMKFAVQSKPLMDQAVIHGDYNGLHVMTDCVYQISQLVALIQIHLPVDSPSPARPAMALHTSVG
jgi:DNA-binding ferritin-like protein